MSDNNHTADDGAPLPDEAVDLPVAPGTVLLGKYRVDRVIGVGGMGRVTEAYHLDFDEKVAIKFLLPSLVDNEEAVGRFEREARVLYKIKSENVCRVIDVGKLDDSHGASAGVPFMVMEYLDGYDLATLLHKREPLPLERAIEYGLQACQALANAHVRSIVHRDLKPENLFVAHETSGELVLKLLDFGLSKEHDADAEGENRQRKLTANEQVMGTPHYMSPEQWMASTAVSPASDQWSLAAIIFEMLTGRPPFDGPQLGAICSAIINAPTPSLSRLRPDAPPGLDSVITKALEKHPHARYENVGAFAVALAAFARPGVAMKAERTLKMLQRHEYNEEDVSIGWKKLKSPYAQSDMMATIPKPSVEKGFELFDRVRTVTSTSWQHMNLKQPGGRAAVGIAAALLIAITGVALFVIVSSAADTEASPAATGLEAEAETSASNSSASNSRASNSSASKSSASTRAARTEDGAAKTESANDEKSSPAASAQSAGTTSPSPPQDSPTSLPSASTKTKPAPPSTHKVRRPPAPTPTKVLPKPKGNADIFTDR